MTRKTQEGFDALRHSGQIHSVPVMHIFTKCYTRSVGSNGEIEVMAPGGSFLVRTGQWVVTKPDGFQVVDDDKIVLAPWQK